MSSAPQAVVDLVERYCRNRELYHRSEYNETQVRVEFIDPLFMALGWDVHNERGAAPQYCDVVHEASVRIRGTVRSPDYAFRMGPKEVFYVEAKKPSVNVHEDASPAYQLRRYAWTAKLPVSVLTDFEELSIYEGRRSRPSPDDGAATARVMYFTCDEYIEHWDEIAGVLSKDAVMRGDLDRFADKAVGKRGTQEVDAAFLAEIENWRQLLARNLALRNANLSGRELNYAVQKIIDRLIFLRIAEDRGIEPYEQLRNAAVGKGIYPRLLQRFRNADAKYNSGLFHFDEEKGHNETRDTLTPSLTLDDKTLREIITSLYYPTCPYEFSVLGADILGHVYEQFLGSVISLTPGHRARIEQKPEVRKAGGVYYTPTYIVDYIVQQTVGQLVDGKSPGQVAHLRILDPACGSGSFLLGAYQFLLDWHLTWYAEHQHVKQRPEIYFDQHGQPKLTIDTKKRILTNNIYGVDIDGQAVEVTKLSLLLKVLEGENEASLGAQQLRLFGGQRALPDLSANIQCGNSLIGSDYLEQASLLDEDEMYRINPFDWEEAFPEVFGTHGGFDAVIGNPPYVSFYSRESIKPLPAVEKHLIRKYSKEIGGRKNTFLMFLVQSLRLKSAQGCMSMIVPDTLAINDSYQTTRRYLTRSGIHEISRLDFAVFDGPAVRTIIPVCGPSTDTVQMAVYDTASGVATNSPISKTMVPKPTILARRTCKWRFSDLSVQCLLSKIESQVSVPLETIAETRDGINPGPKLFRKSIVNPSGPPRSTWRSLIEGRHVTRFLVLPTSEIVDYDPSLLTHSLKKKGASFRDPRIFTAPKLVNRQTANTLVFALDEVGCCTLNSVHNTRAKDNKRDTLLYLLGLLNSTTLRGYYRIGSEETRDVFPQVHISALRKLPIRTIDFDDPADVARHDRMVSLVERMLDLHKQLAAAALPQQKKLLQRQIDATDKQIDELVYELYGLTEEEIAIVEGA